MKAQLDHFASWVIATLAMMVAPLAHAQDITFEPVGTPIIDRATISGISADGSVVIGTNISSLSEQHAFRWQNGVLESISPDGMTAESRGVSADGSVVVGRTQNALGGTSAFRWENGTLEEISLLGGWNSEANAVSADGSTVVGKSQNDQYHIQAFRWKNGTIEEISLGGWDGVANAVSADGSVVVGASQNMAGLTHAFYWNNGNIQEISLGGMSGEAKAVSADGSTVVGKSQNAQSYTQAFRWQNGYIEELSLGGTSGEATAVSVDGSVVVGISQNSTGYQQIFRWEDGQIEQLSLGGFIGTHVAMSADGSVVVGNSTNNIGIPISFRWTEEDGIKTLEQILIDAGVDLTGWNFSGGTFSPIMVSGDGRVIAGTSLYNASLQSYVMTMNGLITPEEIVNATQPVAQQAKQIESSVVNGINQSLVVARNAITGYFPRVNAYTLQNQNYAGTAHLKSYAPIASRHYFGPSNTRRRAFYALGHYGTGHHNNFANDSGSGSTGILFEINDRLVVGGGLVGSINNTETRLGGHNRSQSWGANILAAYEPPAGLRLYGAVTAAALETTSRRRYMNGGGIDSSAGQSNGMGYGVALRAGYEIPVTPKTSVMPYTEWQISHSRINGYTETGGAFPVTVDDQKNTLVTSRLGAEISYDISPNMTIRGRGAWGHRYTESGSTSVTTIGLTTLLPGTDGDRDWIEAGGTINYHISEYTTLSADVMARSSKTAEPAVSATIGLVWKW